MFLKSRIAYISVRVQLWTFFLTCTIFSINLYSRKPQTMQWCVKINELQWTFWYLEIKILRSIFSSHMLLHCSLECDSITPNLFPFIGYYFWLTTTVYVVYLLFNVSELIFAVIWLHLCSLKIFHQNWENLCMSLKIFVLRRSMSLSSTSNIFK